MSAPAFALLAGIFLAALGALGALDSLAVRSAWPEPPVAFSYFLGLFTVNAAINALHFTLGLWGLVAWAGALSAVNFARGLALIAGAMALAALMPALNPLFRAFPLHGHDAWLHAALAILGAWVGFRSLARHHETLYRARRSERRITFGDRRQAALPVALERRRGRFDRRQADFGGPTLAH